MNYGHISTTRQPLVLVKYSLYLTNKCIVDISDKGFLQDLCRLTQANLHDGAPCYTINKALVDTHL